MGLCGSHRSESAFSYPKSIHTVVDSVRAALSDEKHGYVLDYFAGSGTTGHAVLNLNREDDGNRKYILVEMGEYFYISTLTRMKKVIYSADWKGGKPENRNTGVSHIMKYITLESYEDALSNIELNDDMHSLFALMGEDYMLRYMFNYEAKDSMLPLDAFEAPFTYQLKINENNETKDKTVDLCETFNYLIGLSVIRQSAATPEEHTIDGQYIPYLDYERILDELETYKNEKFYYNISISKDGIADVLKTNGWYSLIIPKMHISITVWIWRSCLL